MRSRRGRGRGPLSDCPSGLVRNQQASGGFRRYALYRDLYLAGDGFLPHAPAHVVGLFAHANQRAHSVAQRQNNFAIHQGVGLTEIAAALGVAELHQADPEFVQHGGGNLAGIRAGFGPVHVLRAHPEVRRAEPLHGFDGGKGRNEIGDIGWD